jgi:hypothetical protein
MHSVREAAGILARREAQPLKTIDATAREPDAISMKAAILSSDFVYEEVLQTSGEQVPQGNHMHPSLRNVDANPVKS